MPPFPPAVQETIVTPRLEAPVAGRLAPTPYNFEFTGEDYLRLSVANAASGVTVAVHWRLLDRKGRVVANRITFVASATRLYTTSEFGIGEGYLLNATVFADAGAPLPGETYAKLQVIRGLSPSATVLGTIVQGYVTANQDLGWPGSPLRNADEAARYVRTIIGTNPAAGSEVSETVPTGAVWNVQAIALTLVTDATIANRSVQVEFSDGANIFFRVRQAADVGASQSAFIFAAAGVGKADYVSGTGSMNVALPPGLQLRGGYIVRTSTLNLQAGDNYGAPFLNVYERLEG